MLLSLYVAMVTVMSSKEGVDLLSSSMTVPTFSSTDTDDRL